MMKSRIARLLILVLIVSLLVPAAASAAGGPYHVELTLTGPDKDGITQTVSSNAYYQAANLTLKELVFSFGDLTVPARETFPGTGLSEKFADFYDAAKGKDDDLWADKIDETTIKPEAIIDVIKDRTKTVADFVAVTSTMVATFTVDSRTYTVRMSFVDTDGVIGGGGGGGGGGGNTKTYTVSLDSTVNGSATISATKAKQGDTIFVTPTPSVGHVVKDVVATGENSGSNITVTKNTDGTYSFTMPAENVKVSVTFKRPFDDVKETDWFYNAVYYCYDKGWLKGVSDTEFDPAGSLSRAMFMTALWRMAGEPEATGENPFSDVDNDQWYTQAVIWAYEQGVIQGYGDGIFGTKDGLTREQMVVILWRAAGKPAGTGDLSKFSDGDKVSSWAKDAVSWAVGIGWMNGDETGALNPRNDATRAQIAQVMMNIDKLLGLS